MQHNTPLSLYWVLKIPHERSTIRVYEMDLMERGFNSTGRSFYLPLKLYVTFQEQKKNTGELIRWNKSCIYVNVYPPSTRKSAPVTYPLASEER